MTVEALDSSHQFDELSGGFGVLVPATDGFLEGLGLLPYILRRSGFLAFLRVTLRLVRGSWNLGKFGSNSLLLCRFFFFFFLGGGAGRGRLDKIA